MTSFLDADGIAALLPRPNITPTPTPTPTATMTPTPSPEQNYLRMYPAIGVPPLMTIESVYSRGSYATVISPPEGGLAGSVNVAEKPEAWSIQRAGETYVFRSQNGQFVLAVGPGMDCSSPVVWNAPAGPRSQFLISKTYENPEAVVISTIKQEGSGSCSDGKIRFLGMQESGGLKLLREPPTSKTLQRYLWLLRPAMGPPVPPPPPPPEPIVTTPPPTALPIVSPSTLPPINVNISNPGANPFPYPVAPNLLVGGVVDPLLMNPTLAPTTPAPTTAAPGVMTMVPTDDPDDDDEDLFPIPTPTPAWTSKRIAIYVLLALALGIAGYYAYKAYSSKKKGGGGGGNNTNVARNNTPNNNNTNFGNINLRNNRGR